MPKLFVDMGTVSPVPNWLKEESIRNVVSIMKKVSLLFAYSEKA
jgi:hypothetical protein